MTKKTYLYEEHQKLNATIVEFADWLMPLHYGSQLNEHLTVRNEIALFDVSHMTVIDIKGPQAKSFLRILLANDIQKIQASSALYSCMLNPSGGVKDDLIAYCIDASHYRLVVNASTQEKDLAWITMQAQPFDLEITWRQDLSIIAVQGPKLWEKVEQLFNPEKYQRIRSLKPFSFTLVDEWMIAHTGYTGETGLEIMLPHQQAIQFWQQCIESGIKPAGLGARDSLRLEAGLNLYGQDMDENISPLESNLAWTVDFKDKERHFIGRSALEEQLAKGIQHQLMGLVLEEKGVCRKGMIVFATEQQGILTSGGYSPTLSCGIGMARMPIVDNRSVQIDIRGKKAQAKLIKLPFVRKGKATF